MKIKLYSLKTNISMKTNTSQTFWSSIDFPQCRLKTLHIFILSLNTSWLLSILLFFVVMFCCLLFCSLAVVWLISKRLSSCAPHITKMPICSCTHLFVVMRGSDIFVYVLTSSLTYNAYRCYRAKSQCTDQYKLHL